MKENTGGNQIELSIQDYNDILNHCFSNIFVTDGLGKIIYANREASRALNCPVEELLSMDVYQLKERGYTDHSSTDDVLRTGKRAIAVYRNNLGEEIATTSTPVYDEKGQIKMVVTRSNEMGSMAAYQEELKRQQELAKIYKGAIDFIDNVNSSSQNIIARDPSMMYILHTLHNLARSDSTIMLYGESGVGKEVMANYIRQCSNRKDKVFIPINCSAIPSELIESELFGYERGAFTGANKEGKAGLFEVANGGTIFMDEIGELPLMAQSKLLRVLENGEYMRVGGDKVHKTDVRIIGATNRDLRKMIENKEFRDDLYYRLNVMPIVIPALRDRPLDIEALAEDFLAKYNRKHGQQRVIPQSMKQWMRTYRWPGNIRELRNVIERFVITGDEENPGMSDSAMIDPDASAIPQGRPSQPVTVDKLSTPSLPVDTSRPLKTVMDEMEAKYISMVLSECHGNVSEAAEHLGIHRSVLYKKIGKYNIK